MLNDLSVFLLAAGMMQAALLSVFLLLPSNIIQVSNRLLVIVLLTLAAGFGELFLYGSGVSFFTPELRLYRYAYLSASATGYLSVYPFADVSPFSNPASSCCTLNPVCYWPYCVFHAVRSVI